MPLIGDLMGRIQHRKRAWMALVVAFSAFVAVMVPAPARALQLTYELFVNGQRISCSPLGLAAIFEVPCYFTVPAESGVQTFSAYAHADSATGPILFRVDRGINVYTAAGPISRIVPPGENPCDRVILKVEMRVFVADVPGTLSLGYVSNNAPDQFAIRGSVAITPGAKTATGEMHLRPPCGYVPTASAVFGSFADPAGEGFRLTLDGVPQPYDLFVDEFTVTDAQVAGIVSQDLDGLAAKIRQTPVVPLRIVVDKLGAAPGSLLDLAFDPLPATLDFTFEKRRVATFFGNQSRTFISFNRNDTPVRSVVGRIRIDDTPPYPSSGFSPDRSAAITLNELPATLTFSLEQTSGLICSGSSCSDPRSGNRMFARYESTGGMLELLRVDAITSGPPCCIERFFVEAQGPGPGRGIPSPITFELAKSRPLTNLRAKERNNLLITSASQFKLKAAFESLRKETGVEGTIPTRFEACIMEDRGCAPEIEYATVPSIGVGDVPLSYRTTVSFRASQAVPITVTERLPGQPPTRSLAFENLTYFSLALPAGRGIDAAAAFHTGIGGGVQPLRATLFSSLPLPITFTFIDTLALRYALYIFSLVETYERGKCFGEVDVDGGGASDAEDAIIEANLC